MKKVELLAPAGDLSKLKIAVKYGADAVYIGGDEFSLRAASKNFSLDDIAKGVEFAHKNNVKVYLAINIFPKNDDIKKLPDYVKEVAKTKIDAFIVSDLGVFAICEEYAPEVEIHISTQANNVNFMSAKQYKALGASRVVMARELSFKEIFEIHEKVPDIELEMFVHGAMCISYSGRCLLSSYMTGRDANKGDCAQSCRWNYALMEEKRQGEYFPIYEDEKGSFILNSKDLCLIKRIPDIISAGVTSLKIEGRVKTEYYVACIVSAYRRAIDFYYENGNKELPGDIFEEVMKISHRDYYEGFVDGQGSEGQVYTDNNYVRDYELIAYVEGYDTERKMALCKQRNKFFAGDTVDILRPHNPPLIIKLEKIFDSKGNEIESTPHADMDLLIPIDTPLESGCMIRKIK